MSICIVGYKGNMGRRYTAILDCLQEPWVGVETNDTMKIADNYIVATPTATHMSIIKSIKRLKPNARILCEKPFTLWPEELNHLKQFKQNTIFMVNNYQYLAREGEGITYYNYYNSGSDGLAWDCIQLIYLANGFIDLRQKSPFWECEINGTPIGKDEIDGSYVHMIRDFLSEKPVKLWGLPEIMEAHAKVLRYLEANK